VSYRKELVGILPGSLRALEPAVAPFGSGVELGQPAQRAQARDEAVLAAAVDHEPGQVRQAAADGPLGDGELAAAIIRAHPAGPPYSSRRPISWSRWTAWLREEAPSLR
jgi:hypothetical protein